MTMYSFKTAKRVETNTIWANQLNALLERDELPGHVTDLGINKHGHWYKANLPASVYALAVKSEEGITVGYYHSPANLDDELKEALNVKPKKRAS